MILGINFFSYIRNYNEQRPEQIIHHAISGTPFEALDQKLIKSVRAILCAYLHYKNGVGLPRSAKPSHTITVGYRMLAFYKQAGAWPILFSDKFNWPFFLSFSSDNWAYLEENDFSPLRPLITPIIPTMNYLTSFENVGFFLHHIQSLVNMMAEAKSQERAYGRYYHTFGH
ncbi:hypothetical protein BDB00DRAFT_934492 [Zychaea mexicana]|uniref:uncharacterized protein n=1 Tax=Zychaea mexicana TaxID=64656 RepID=UPI0022FF124E|nr:uncharacterized protein BDB00DRAFT_934492 [Zychaea mexicana]KAI9468851.1 hypothetical protein BDB00DRAFT_934492 [Zychaea mexicana]